MTALQSKYSGWLIHLTAWAVIFGMPLFVTSPDRPLMTGSEYLRFLLVPLSFMVVFYTNYFLLIERYLFTRQTGRFLGGNALLIAAVIVGLHLLFRYVLPPDAQHPPLPRHVEVGVSLPEEPSPTPVAPLLFISLIENAFKHGTSNDRPSFIRIDIHERGGELVCRIRNSCFPKTASDRSGSGIGLKNLSKRLEMIYPQRHTFEYGERGGTYTASLRIKLHER